VSTEDLLLYLDGECPPEAEEEIERGLRSDPDALALFRRLCRQRFLLAQTLRRRGIDAGPAAGPRFRWPWQLAAAAALFGATLLALWTRPAPAPAGVEVFAGGNAPRRVVPGTPIEVAAGSTADIVCDDASEVVLHALSRAVFRGPSDGVRETLELAQGTAAVRVQEGAAPFRLRTPAGTVDVGGAAFTVELVPDADPAGKPQHSMQVRVAEGAVRVVVAGRTHAIRAGEVRAFRADGATADSLRGLRNREPEPIQMRKKPVVGEPEEPRKE
jgi:ferric-dicitrate binding protein FerR (iron transport regulator)